MAGGARLADPLSLEMEGGQEVALMLDPSLLLSLRTLPVITGLARRGELRGAVIPQTFFEFVGERGLNQDVLRFFGGPAGEREYGRLADILPLIRALREYLSPWAPSAEGPEADILRAIGRQHRSPQVVALLREEWAFLTAHSWIASRIKHPFSAFVRAGAFAVEGSRDTFDRLVARTLHKHGPPPPGGFPVGDRLRAVVKWVAVGGMSALPLFTGILAPVVLGEVVVGATFRYFLLFDP